MRTRLHPPALALFERIGAGHFDSGAWLREFYGAPMTLTALEARSAADDLATVLQLVKRRGAAYESAARLYRALAQRTVSMPQTTVDLKWKRPPVLSTPDALERWLVDRFGALTQLDDAGRRLARSALDMLEKLGLVSSTAAIHAELVRSALELPA